MKNRLAICPQTHMNTRGAAFSSASCSRFASLGNSQEEIKPITRRTFTSKAYLFPTGLIFYLPTPPLGGGRKQGNKRNRREKQKSLFFFRRARIEKFYEHLEINERRACARSGENDGINCFK
jgi:hypothetical protein